MKQSLKAAFKTRAYPKETDQCGRVASRWFEQSLPMPSRDQSNFHQDESARKSARKNQWEKKKARKAKR